MADEYIRKQDAVNMFNRAVQDVGILDADDIEIVFGMLSPVDVAPVRHGRWIKEYRAKGQVANMCTECGVETGRVSKYCPNCGAKMDIHGEV